MRKVLWLPGIALAISFSGQAAPIPTCAAGTYASFIALGTSGCSVNDQDFFGFTNLPTSFGSTPIAPGSINVTPITTQFAPGLLFSLNASAAPGQLFESMVGFDVTPLIGGAMLGGGTLTQNAATATGDAAVIGVATFCLNGALTATGGCPTNLSGRNLGTQTLSGIPPTTSDSLTFLQSYGLLGVTGHFSVGGGTIGSATASSFAIQVQATPEPATLALTGLALAGLGFLRRKNRVRIG